MTHEAWTCPKCGHCEFDVDEVRTEGGALSAVFDVSTRRYTAIVCDRCAYTEFYRARAGDIENVFDFFVS